MQRDSIVIFTGAAKKLFKNDRKKVLSVKKWIKRPSLSG
jgi:hypothetical protein